MLFKDGTFVDLKNADLHELDQIATDLDLNEKQIDSGRITIPGYQAFLLDAQVDDDGKSESFVDYVNDVKILITPRSALAVGTSWNTKSPYRATASQVMPCRSRSK